MHAQMAMDRDFYCHILNLDTKNKHRLLIFYLLFLGSRFFLENLNYLTNNLDEQKWK